MSRLVVVAGPDPVAATELLRTEVARFCGVPVDRIELAHRCPRCGSEDHGRPHVVASPGSRVPHVSLSRAPGLALVAVTDAGPVGVDVEPATAGCFAGFDDVALHPREHVSSDADRTRTWVRKEALLKATGDGLRVDPRTVRLAGPGQPAAVLDWPARPEPVCLYDLVPAPGHVGAVAVLTTDRPPLVLAARPAAATPPGPGAAVR